MAGAPEFRAACALPYEHPIDEMLERPAELRALVDRAVDAARRAIDAGVKADELDEERFAQFLYTARQPDPDLLIRTSGEMRISNFLLWQISYAELVVTPALWPDFRKPHLCEAIEEYARRHRRFGGV